MILQHFALGKWQDLPPLHRLISAAKKSAEANRQTFGVVDGTKYRIVKGRNRKVIARGTVKSGKVVWKC